MRLNKFMVLVIIICMFFNISIISAKTLADLKSELAAAEAKYSKNASDKKQTESDIAATKEKINSINSQKAQVSKEMEDLNDEITKLGEEIGKMREEIKNIMHYYQLSNSNSLYLEYVFSATDFTDFIYRLAVSEQLSEHREKTIDKYNSLMEENKKKIDELAVKQTSLSKLEADLSVELSKLNSDLSGLVEVSVDINDEIKELKSSISTYTNKYKCSLNEEISTCVSRYNTPRSGGSGSISVPSASGFYRPVTSGRINANYGYTA